MTRLVGDVMNAEPASVGQDVDFKEIAGLMAERMISALPVVDGDDRVVGIVSEADLIVRDETFGRRSYLLESHATRVARRKVHAATAKELMTTPAIVVSPEASLSEAAGLMRRNRVKRLPVCDSHGRLLGVISRLDLVRQFLREDPEIAEEVNDVLRHELPTSAFEIHPWVEGGVVTLEGQVERRSQLPFIVDRVRRVDGTIDVINRLSWAEDDQVLELGPIPRIGF